MSSLISSVSSSFGLNTTSPKIVRGGLVLNLDVGQQTSYRGSGTVWTDLSGLGNNGTLVGGVGYNSSNGGSLVFANNYVALGKPSSLNILGNITINSWVNLSSLPGGFASIYENGYDGINDQTFFRFNGSLLEVGNYRSTGDQYVSWSFGSNIVANKWYHIVGQYDGTNWKLYLNGNQVASNAALGPISSTAPISIGAAYIASGYTRYFNGNIAQVSIYNRALTATEIQQNFNALRGRFGI